MVGLGNLGSKKSEENQDQPKVQATNDGVGGKVQGESTPINKQASKSTESEPVTYTSHPVSRFSVGRKYQFENGVMKLSPEEAEEFDEVLKGQPNTVKNRVKKVDVEAGEKLARQYMASRSTQGIDTSEIGPGSPEGPHAGEGEE